jgi:hypothetical protein
MNLQFPSVNFAVQPIAGSRQAVKLFATPAVILVSEVVVNADTALDQAKLKLTTQLHSSLYNSIFQSLDSALRTMTTDPTAGLKQLAQLHHELKTHL